MKSGRYIVNRVTEGTTGPQTESLWQDEEKAPMCRGRRCLVLMTVCLGFICVLLLVIICVLLVFILLQLITITAEIDLLKSYKFNHIISLQGKNTDLMAEKDQLKNNFSSLSQKKLELETELRELSKQGNCSFFFISNELMSWSDSRKFCRDRGADLAIINTLEKQKLISSVVKENVWIGLSDIETEGIMKWVANSALNQGFWYQGEPNNEEDEDCIEMMPTKDPVNNWNDQPCSDTRTCICEKQV